jgi:hypothetical protein
MENFFIPNSTPAIGRISTKSLARSKKRNSASGSFFGPFSLTITGQSWTLSLCNAQRPTLNAQHSIEKSSIERTSIVRHRSSLTNRCGLIRVGRWALNTPCDQTRDKNPENAQRPTPNVQRPTQKIAIKHIPSGRRGSPSPRHRGLLSVRRSMFDVGRSAFSLHRRVKGAWWPSRSSKPLLVRQLPDQGRFDSYPLRFFACRRFAQAVAAALCRRVSIAPVERGSYNTFRQYPASSPPTDGLAVASIQHRERG